MKFLHLGLLFLSGLACWSPADITLNKIFTDHMVLQRDNPVNLYGTGSEGESVTVTLGSQTKSTLVSEGKWKLQLDPMPANHNSQSMTVEGNNTVTLNDILVGDVWVLGGQSNMHRGIRQYSELSPDTINNQNIRMIVMEFNPQEPAGPSDVVNFAYGATTWEPANFSAGGATANIVENFSATGLYFALELQPVLDVPIGLIGAYRGATRAECWTPRTTLEAHEELKYYLDNHIPDDITKTSSWLYNAVVHPITGISIKGILWYQGESNGQRPWEHGFLFPRMIQAWRTAFGQGDVPFIFAQLASYKPLDWDLTGGLAWAYNKMSQRRGLDEPNTGMITLYDAGEWEDIHPQAKPTAGYRFAMKVRQVAYGENLVSSGPVAASMEILEDKVKVNFTNAGDGLETRAVSMKKNLQAPFEYLTAAEDTLIGFEVSGADGNYRHALAEIQGNSVVVSSPEVLEPIAVRYAFHSFTLANLYNKEGFPAEQFYSDNFDWPMFMADHEPHQDPVRDPFPTSVRERNKVVQDSFRIFRSGNQILVRERSESGAMDLRGRENLFTPQEKK